MKSIRRALLRRFSVASLALLLLGAVVLFAGVRWLLTDQFDEYLRTRLATFATLLEQEGYDIELALVAQHMPQFSAENAPEYAQIYLADGEDLYRSPSLGERDLPFLAGTLEAPLVKDLSLPDGRAGRAVGAEFTINFYEPGAADPGPARVVVVMAVSRAPLDRALLLVLGGTAAGIALLLGAWLLVGRDAVARGLKPLDDLAQHVSAIDDPLQTPSYPVTQLPAELAPLADSHNQMLARIRTAFERERRTTANIAHELRAPVAELVLLADTAQRYPADRAETARRLGELREIGEQISNMIATLLELARLESGQVPLEIEPIDLAQMVRDCWVPQAAAATAKGQEFTAPPAGGPPVRADRAALSILLANLLGNAVEHGAAGEPIRCDVEHGESGSALVLTNGANGFRAEDVDKLTEPFWRASPTRANGSHAGIGLSLARRLAELLDIDLGFSVESGVFAARLGFAPAEREA